MRKDKALGDQKGITKGNRGGNKPPCLIKILANRRVCLHHRRFAGRPAIQPLWSSCSFLIVVCHGKEEGTEGKTLMEGYREKAPVPFVSPFSFFFFFFFRSSFLYLRVDWITGEAKEASPSGKAFLFLFFFWFALLCGSLNVVYFPFFFISFLIF